MEELHIDDCYIIEYRDEFMTVYKDGSVGYRQEECFLTKLKGCSDEIKDILESEEFYDHELISSMVNSSVRPKEIIDYSTTSETEMWHAKLFNIPVYCEYFDWIGKRMRVYMPEMCFAATLAFFGVKIAGRASVDDEFTSNLMINALADSGSGKSQALRAIKKSLRETGDKERQTIDSLISQPGLFNELVDNPAGFISIDEIGLEMKKWTSPRSPESVQGIKSTLISAYTSYADEIYLGKRGDNKLNSGASIKNPCPSLFGVSTPGKFWENIGIDDVSSGMLNRQIIVDATNCTNGRKKVINSKTPASVIDWSEKFMHRADGASGIIDLRNPDGSKKNNPIKLHLSPGAQKLWDETITEMEDKKVNKNDELSLMWMRLGEITMRLAIQIQLVEDYTSRFVELKTMMRAYTMAKSFIQDSYNACVKNLSAGKIEKMAERLAKEIKSFGAAGVSGSDMHSLKTIREAKSSRDSGSFVNYKDLAVMARTSFSVHCVGVEDGKTKTTGRGPTTKYYVHDDFYNEFKARAEKNNQLIKPIRVTDV